MKNIRHKEEVLYDPIYCKGLWKANLEREKLNYWLPEPKGEKGYLLKIGSREAGWVIKCSEKWVVVMTVWCIYYLKS